jgi:hypothetical protein
MPTTGRQRATIPRIAAATKLEPTEAQTRLRLRRPRWGWHHVGSNAVLAGQAVRRRRDVTLVR